MATNDAGAAGTDEEGGTGGTTVGSGGASAGSGGAKAGSGGATAGSGGTTVGSGGATAGSGGATAGSGGAVGPHSGPVLQYSFDAGSGLTAADSSGLGRERHACRGDRLDHSRAQRCWPGTVGRPSPTTYVTVPPGVFAGVKSTTIATWVKLNADVAWNRIFDFGGQGTGTDTRFMYLTTNTPQGMLFSTFGGVPTTREAVITTNTLLPLGVWKHVAVTIADGGHRSIYLDGFPAADATTIDIPPSESSNRCRATLGSVNRASPQTRA